MMDDRHAFSVLTGGTGVLAYLAAWALIPAEGEKASIAEDLLSKPATTRRADAVMTGFRPSSARPPASGSSSPRLLKTMTGNWSGSAGAACRAG